MNISELIKSLREIPISFCLSASSSPHYIPLSVPGVHVALTDNATSSEGVILMEGEGTVDDLIRISVPEPHSIPVQVSVSVSSGSAERGVCVCV